MSTEETNRASSLRRPRRREGVAHDLADDGAVALFDRAGLRLLVLDAVGSGVWELADGTRTQGDIVEEMLAVFPGADRARVTEDVERFLESLARDELLDFV